jgi:hypothetical protein
MAAFPDLETVRLGIRLPSGSKKWHVLCSPLRSTMALDGETLEASLAALREFASRWLSEAVLLDLMIEFLERESEPR